MSLTIPSDSHMNLEEIKKFAVEQVQWLGRKIVQLKDSAVCFLKEKLVPLTKNIWTATLPHLQNFWSFMKTPLGISIGSGALGITLLILSHTVFTNNDSKFQLFAVAVAGIVCVAIATLGLVHAGFFV